MLNREDREMKKFMAVAMLVLPALLVTVAEMGA
jgi:hypothetical protein